MKKILIVGATSAIAIAFARIWAGRGCAFYLVARSAEKMNQVANDLLVRGASSVEQLEADLSEFSLHPALIEASFSSLRNIDIAVIAHGSLPDQKKCEADVNTALREFNVNGLSVISLLTLLANRFEQQRHGSIVVISSVAGERGRPSNYLYGSAKGAVTVFCQGLSVRLFKLGVHLLTVKPGFVDTPMTKGLELPNALVSTPEKVAASIDKAVRAGKNSLYTPWFWFWIMAIIKSIPTVLFRKLSL